MRATYFGDKNRFAIRYIPGYKTKGSNYYYAFLHLVLSGQIIGDSNESCFLLSWLASMKELLNRIQERSEVMESGEFRDRSDEEIFELIWKANQLEDEFDLTYDYLPILDSSVWAACHLSIDETTDAWLITVTKEKDDLKFIWKGWRDPCPEDRIDKIYSVRIERELVIKTIKNCIHQLEKEYKQYPEMG